MDTLLGSMKKYTAAATIRVPTEIVMISLIDILDFTDILLSKGSPKRCVPLPDLFDAGGAHGSYAFRLAASISLALAFSTFMRESTSVITPLRMAGSHRYMKESIFSADSGCTAAPLM